MARSPASRYRLPFPAKAGVDGGVVESVAHLTELVGKMIEDGTVDTNIDPAGEVGGMVVARRPHATAPGAKGDVHPQEAAFMSDT